MAKKSNIPRSSENELLSLNEAESLNDSDISVSTSKSNQIDFSLLQEKAMSYEQAQKEERNGKFIEQANEQEREQKEKERLERQFREVSKELSPIYTIIFSLINQILTRYSIAPLDDSEQKDIQLVILDFTSSAISSSIEKAESIIEVSKNAPKFIRLVNVLIKIVLPRVMNLMSKSKTVM